MSKNEALKKFIQSFCSVKSVLTIAFGIAIIIFTKSGIVDGEKFLSISTLLIGSLVGAAGKNAAVETDKNAPESPAETPKTTVSITTTPPPVQVITGAKTGDLEESAEMAQSAANIGE